jgi:rare lipoprotein A
MPPAMRNPILPGAVILALFGPAAIAGDQQSAPMHPPGTFLRSASPVCIREQAPVAPTDATLPEEPACPAVDPPLPAPSKKALLRRILDQFARDHRVDGLASYYSAKFDGRRTASGEVFRNSRYSAAHLTLPLGTWIEVKSRATGRKLRLKVNDRGPFARKFFLDLSQAAARFLGVDSARDRYVEIRVIALPGEKPPPEESTDEDTTTASEDTKAEAAPVG